eukprot:g34627.t1
MVLGFWATLIPRGLSRLVVISEMSLMYGTPLKKTSKRPQHFHTGQARHAMLTASLMDKTVTLGEPARLQAYIAFRAAGRHLVTGPGPEEDMSAHIIKNRQ